MTTAASTQANPAINIHETNFEGNTITTVVKDGSYFVALKPIFEGMGLDWKNQYQKLKDDVVISSVMVLSTTTGRDGKLYEMICIPMEYLNGVLFKINPARCPAEVREKVIQYQKECYRVLHDHFFPTSKELPPVHDKTHHLKDKLTDNRTQLNYRKTIFGMEKQAEKEADRIYKGNGTLEDLALCPDIQAMTRAVLEGLNRGDMFKSSKTDTQGGK